ncbi:MAG: PAS domain S-box protein [Deferrisomatales bacterium]
MAESDRNVAGLRREIEELRARLADAEEHVRAFRAGEVDAVVVYGDQAERVYTLLGADHSYRVMVEQMNEAAVVLARNLTVLFANANLAKLVGEPSEDVLGASFERFVPDDENRAFRSLLERAREGGCTGELLLLAGGRRIPVDLSLSPVALDSVDAVCLLITDLTEQKRNARMLAKGQLASAILEQQAEVTVVCGPDGRILQASRVTDRLCGRNPVGEKLESVLPLELTDGRRFWMGTVRPGESVQGVHALVRRDEEPVRHLLLSATSLTGQRDEHLGWVLSLADITERQRAQEETSRQRATLEGVNKILGAALTNATERELGVACLEVAQQLTQSKFGFIGEVNEKGLEDIAISDPGWDACAVVDAAGHRVIGGFKIHGIYGRVISDGRPLFTNDPTGHPDRIGLPAGHPAIGAFLGVPLFREGRTVGMIAVANRPGGYTLAEQEALEALAPAIVEAFLRKRAEQALRKSEALYRGIGESIDYGVWVCAPTGENLYASESFLKMVGITQEQCSNFGWGGVLHPDDAERTIAAWQECVRTGGNWDIEHRFRGVDGQWHHVLARGVPIRDERGEITCWAGINLDITERKRIEGRLRESESRERERAEQLHELSQRLTYHVDHSPLAVVEWGPDMRLIRWSGEAERLFGWKAEEVLGKRMDEFRWIYEEDEPQVEEVKTELLSGTNMRRFSANRNYRKDGAVVHCEWHNSSLLDESGQLRSILSLVLDVTERKRAEEELRQAKEAADAAARAKSEFLANMSHEIRTPMNAVIGFTDLLLGTPLDPDQRRFLDLIKSSGEALLDVVNDVLDLSKMEAGRFDFVEEAFNLRDVTEKVTRSLGLRAHQKGLELTGHIPFSVPTAIVGDPARLRQVLVNLLGNAIKFTERGDVHLAVRRVEPAAEGSEGVVSLRFSVRDTGIGIPREKLGLLFQSFQQVDSSSTRRHEGTGLGLFISRRIVEQMGGRIEVESVEGEGSAFSFTVPFRLQPGATAGTAEVTELRGHRVLVVDDNATNRIIVLEMLTTQGMAVALASGGEEALGLLRAAEAAGQPYELLLVDCQMPRMDGFQLIERVKGDRRFPQPAIVMITSDDLPAYSARARAAGAAAYLVKPVVCAELLSAVRSVLLGTGVKEAEPTEEKVPGLAAGRPLRLLLAEDNTVNQLLVRALVERAGWSIDVVEDGRAALAALSGKHEYDLVLMDVQMPVLDGYEATKSLRELEKRGNKARRTPVIGLTARALPGDRQRCLDAGMDDYLAKPMEPQALYDVVRRHVGDSRTREPPAEIPASLLKNPAIVGKIVGQILTDLPGVIAALRAAVERGVPGEIETLAHRLVGSLLVFGARDSTEIARRLEACGREGRLDDATAILETLEEELRRLAAYLEELRRSSWTGSGTAREAT